MRAFTSSSVVVRKMWPTNLDPRSRISWETAIGSGWVTLLVMNSSSVPSSSADMSRKQARHVDIQRTMIESEGTTFKASANMDSLQ